MTKLYKVEIRDAGLPTNSPIAARNILNLLELDRDDDGRPMMMVEDDARLGLWICEFPGRCSIRLARRREWAAVEPLESDGDGNDVWLA